MAKQKNAKASRRIGCKRFLLYTLAILIGFYILGSLGGGSQQDILPTVAQLPTVTATLLPSDTPEPTATITDTPVPSATATITQTPLPSDTPVPSATPSLEELVMVAVEDAVTADREDIADLLVTDIVVTLRFPLSADFAKSEIELMFPQLVCNLREAGLTNRTYQITGTIGVVDSFGNSSTAEGVEMILPWSVTEQINCEDIYNIDLSAIAERWTVSPLLQ